jgi:hypothetical protein
VAETNEDALPTEVAFNALLPEINAVPDDKTLPLNVDVVNAVTLVLGVIPELRALRPEIVDQLPRFDIARFDKLEQYALALNHANTLHRGTLPDKTSIAELGAEVTSARDRLHADAISLAGYGLVNAERLKDCKKAIGYRAAATDVFNLVAVLKEHWPKLEGKTPITLASLNQIGRRAVDLLAAVGVRDQAEITTGEAARLRQKVFTLFVAAYDDARHAVSYLRRRKDEVDAIAPSLWAQPGAGRPRLNPTPQEAEPKQPQHPADAAAEAEADPLPMDNALGLPVTPPFINN